MNKNFNVKILVRCQKGGGMNLSLDLPVAHVKNSYFISSMLQLIELNASQALRVVTSYELRALSPPSNVYIIFKFPPATGKTHKFKSFQSVHERHTLSINQNSNFMLAYF